MNSTLTITNTDTTMLFGDFSTICTYARLPSCNLIPDFFTEKCSLSSSPVRDLGTIIVCIIGVVYVTFQLLFKSHKMYAAVGRKEMSILFFTFACQLILEIFTIGGLVTRSEAFMKWTSAIHLGIIVCFFWILLLSSLILFQFTEDGTKFTIYPLVGSSVVWFTLTAFLALDLGIDITTHHGSYSPSLFFITLVFPVLTCVLYVFMIVVLIYRRLDERRSIFFLLGALAAFIFGQVMQFVLNTKICESTMGRVNGSMFATAFELLALYLLFQFWTMITDDGGDCTF